MTTVDYFPIQDLPTELEREIFETAARMRPGSALDLVLVARKVRTWIQPLIYEMVTLGTDDTSLFRICRARGCSANSSDLFGPPKPGLLGRL